MIDKLNGQPTLNFQLSPVNALSIAFPECDVAFDTWMLAREAGCTFKRSGLLCQTANDREYRTEIYTPVGLEVEMPAPPRREDRATFHNGCRITEEATAPSRL